MRLVLTAQCLPMASAADSWREVLDNPTLWCDWADRCKLQTHIRKRPSVHVSALGSIEEDTVTCSDEHSCAARARNSVCKSNPKRSRWSRTREIRYNPTVTGGRVAQLGEHLLCKHAFILPKSLNRRPLTVQNPPLVGLLIGLQILGIRRPSLDKH